MFYKILIECSEKIYINFFSLFSEVSVWITLILYKYSLSSKVRVL